MNSSTERGWHRTSLIGLALLSLWNTPVYGADAYNPAKSVVAVVNVTTHRPEKNPVRFPLAGEEVYLVNYGSGFAVGPDLFLTNEHVVRGAEKTLLFPVFGSVDDAAAVRVVAADATRDLAILQASLEEKIPLAKTSRLTPEELEKMKGPRNFFYWGVGMFPASGGLVVLPMFRTIHIVAYFSEGGYLMFDPETMGGNSGSPIFDRSAIIGMVKGNMLNKIGWQGVGRAIPAHEIRAFLKENGHEFD